MTDKDEYQLHWLKVKKIIRELEMIRLGRNDDELYGITLKCAINNLHCVIASLKTRIEN